MLFPHRHIFLVFMFLLISSKCLAQTEFITTWQTTTAGETITIPTTGGGYSYNVNWGDGLTDLTTYTGNASHTYTTANTYTVTITGTFNRIYFNATGDKDKILSVEQWGTNQVWTNMSRAFDGCSNLVINASDVPNLSSCSSTLRMFRDATAIGTGSTTNWNSWNISNITNIAQMFRNCSSFNKDISNWVVSGVTNFNNLFNGASIFNQDISGWTTTSATSMNNTFRNSAFDQDISSWDVSGVTSMNNILLGTKLSLANYNALLISWEAQTLQTGVAFHGGTSKYCSPAAIAAKASIIATYSWSFTDGGELTSFTWTGSTDSNWSDSTNWLDGYAPECSLNVTIPTVTNYPNIDISTTADINDLTINSGASLSVSGALTVNGNLITNSGLSLNSGSSLIVSGTSTGNLTYTRDIANGQKYYNTSPPVIGETVENFISSNALNTGNGNVGLYYYDNSTTMGFAGTGYIFYQPSSTGSLTNGKGYGVQLSSAGSISFTGNMPTTDISISVSTGTIDNSNLIGNPFPSYLPANLNANANNLLSNNTSVLSEETLWLWDNTIDDYVTLNNASAARFIAPGQGFFVDASGSGTFNYLESWQSHQATDVFNKKENDIFSLELVVSNLDNQKKNTNIFYYKNKTTGFDNGYDSSQFSGGGNLNIYTKLVSDIESKNLAIQTLPNSNFESNIIPVGIKGDRQIDFKIISQNRPEGINIYLEDRYLNTFTKLEENKSISIDLDEGYYGVGRFFLHTSYKTLTIKNESLQNVNIFISENKTLNIKGVLENITKLIVFDVLGKKLKEIALENNGTNKVSLLNFKNGVYILKLKSKKGMFSKKIFLK